jgi:anti-sigma factor RsiW
MECSEARTHLLDRQRGTLAEALRAPLEAHLASCEACQHEDAADRELSALLEKRLARPRAPERLTRALEARWDPVRRRAGGPLIGRSLAAMVAGAALAVVVVLAWHAHTRNDAMVTEAVNDHLRVLYSERPLEVESGGLHQVKPWFEGRLDFAPSVIFAGDDDFPLQGGAVAYFLDRKAATFVYKRRLHVITLFVFRAEGLPWEMLGLHAIGSARGTLRTARGFHVALWRKADLGYALVSDVDEQDLTTLGAKVAGGG